MPYQKQPFRDDQGIGALMLALLLLVAVVVGLTAMCASPVRSEDGKVVVTVRDFGRGMTPVMPPYVNDPEAIVLSQNMYSTQPGSRQLRFGIVELIDYDSTALVTTAGIDAIGAYTPTHDSTSIVFAAGGRWYGQVTGIRWQANKFLAWLDTFNQVREVRPYPSGQISTATASKKITGTSAARFTRDAQPGDLIIISGDTGIVDYVVADTELYVSANFGANDTGAYTMSRGYPDSVNAPPFLLSSGDYLFTGNRLSPPQAIYSQDTALFIKHLGIVDSFYIDSIYTGYPLVTWSDTTVDTNIVGIGDCPVCTVLTDGTGRRSWDTTATGETYIKEFQLVSRRKAWAYNEWFEDLRENPQTYYVRVGFPHKDVFYQIAGNTDTSIYCMTWYVDTTYDSNSWSDSVLHGVGPDLPDTIPTAKAEGRWGYIYAAAGFSDVVVADSQTGKITLQARGGLWWTVDTGFPIDSTEFYKGMYFIQLTGNDVSFDQYVDSASRLLNEYETGKYDTYYKYTPPPGDSIINTLDWYRCNRAFGDIGPSGKPWRSTESEAEGDCDGRANEYIEHRVSYVVYTLQKNKKTKEADYFSAGSFPIRFASHKGDTIFFVCGVGDALSSTATDTTSNWEIVRVDLPNWSGMAEWNAPPQLVAWGDTLSPSLLSFSDIGNPWNWSSASDVLVGNNPADPIVGVAGYDDGLKVLKEFNTVGYPGFTELSRTVGLVGPRAKVIVNKELYWLAVDGMYMMDRRDFSGYTVKKISAALDPVFNSWSATTFSSSVVPFKINPQYRYKSVLTHNQRDQHLYLFFPEGSSTKNNRCLTYDLQRGQWDGLFTLAASDAMWATIRDTSRIVLAGTDSAIVLGLDYSYNDVGVGINANLKSAKFWVQDDQGWPVESVLGRVRFQSRGLTAAFDSAYIIITGDTRSDTLDLAYNAAWGDIEQLWRPSGNNLSEHWNWEIKTYGDSLIGLFIPYQLQMEFAPVRRDD